MANLIVLSDIQDFRSVSSNLENDRVDPLILEAQLLDIRNVLGPALYLDMVKNITDPIYVDLFNGVEYIDKSINETVSFEGVRAALAYYSYARLLLNQDLHVTASGLVEKDEQWSKSTEEKRIQRQVSAARLAARAHEEEYLAFLRENSTDYPIYLKTCVTTNAHKGSITISKVQRGHLRGHHSTTRCHRCDHIRCTC